MNLPPLLQQVLAPGAGAFALLHRPESVAPDRVEVLLGRISHPARIADIPLDDRPTRVGAARPETLVLVPHRQIAERGFTAVDDGSPLVALSVTGHGSLSRAEAAEHLPDEPISLAGASFDTSDDAYANLVRGVLADEISTGAGSNFVIKRSFVASVTGYSARTALSLFRRLLTRETGAYWTFLVHTGTRTFVGATPERHISLRDGVAAMTPISGTYRYPRTGPVLPEILDFLSDGKETDELYMVLDEELKMMARVCDGGGRVVGPFLRQMAWLAHTEYNIEGRSSLDPRDILRETMFAPTVTGSPLENAFRVIARYEPRGRGYYGGIAALIGRDAGGARTLDSAIMIRTADIRPSDSGGSARVEVGVGATLVRHSDPDAEVTETHTKAAGVLSALGIGERIEGHPLIRQALERRNKTIANFWLRDARTRDQPLPALTGRRALIVDAEDTFSAMLAHQLRALGLTVQLNRFDADHRFDEHDFIVLGPGPGDPRDTTDPRLACMTAAVDQLLAQRTPFLAVCLSHQLLCRRLGLPLRRRDIPNQGIQREIDLFGTPVRAGFYNSFVAHARTEQFHIPQIGDVRISHDPVDGEVHALRGPYFRSVQFHLESVLTQNGEHVLGDLLASLTQTEEVLNA